MHSQKFWFEASFGSEGDSNSSLDSQDSLYSGHSKLGRLQGQEEVFDVLVNMALDDGKT